MRGRRLPEALEDRLQELPEALVGGGRMPGRGLADCIQGLASAPLQGGEVRVHRRPRGGTGGSKVYARFAEGRLHVLRHVGLRISEVDLVRGQRADGVAVRHGRKPVRHLCRALARTLR